MNEGASAIDRIIINAMKEFDVPKKYFTEIKQATLIDYEDEPRSALRNVTIEDIAEIMDASGIPLSGDEENDLGPAARGKSDIIKKWGAEQSKEVTDLPLSEVGDVKFDDYGAVDEDRPFRVRPHDPWMPDTPVPDEFKRDGRIMTRRKGYQAWLQAEKDKVRNVRVSEDDPEGMGKYNVVIQYPDKRYDDELNAEPLPYPAAIDMAQEHIEWLERGFPKTEIVSKREDKGDSVIFVISEFDKFDNSLSEVYTVIVQPADEADVFDSLNLDHIVENLLREYPGQPLDYDEDEKFEREQAERSKHIQRQAKEFEQDKIDPKIEDDELGFRFD